MGSLQKKKVEVSCKMKMEMYDLQRNSCLVYKLTGELHVSCPKKRRNRSTRGHSQDKHKQSNVMVQGLRPSKDESIKASQVFDSERLLQLSLTYNEQDRKAPLDPCEDSFFALGASLDNASISESSAVTLDNRNINPQAPKTQSSKPMVMLENVMAQSGDGCFSHNHEKELSLLESLKEQELPLSNLTNNEPISLANISGKSSLLNLLYFPQKAPAVCSKKKLLILDINGILADIVYPPPKGYKADTKIAGRAVFSRPFCSDFLNFCFERFNVAIWSSRSRKIIDRLVNYLMGDLKHKLIFCWDLSHCTESKFRTLENKHKALVFKELKKVWESYDLDLPWEIGEFDESNTLLLDDTPYKALLNPPYTAIFPYSYNFKDHADDAIGPAGNIRAYLEELAVADNVQKYIEQHPFGQSAITERSLSWWFYDKVIKGQSAVAAGG